MTRAARGRQRGIALLLVLWAFMTLGVLALDFGRYMRDDSMASVNLAEETQAYYTAYAAMTKELFKFEQDRGTAPQAQDTGDDEEKHTGAGLAVADGTWYDEQFAGGHAQVRVTDECARISLNQAKEPLLRTVITNLQHGTNKTKGMNTRESTEIDSIVGAIIDWRDRNHFPSLHGAEDDPTHGYEAKDAPFDSVQELLRVKGVTADLYYGGDGRPGLRDVFSVYCETETVNANSVTAPVMVALGVDPDRADELVQERTDNPTAFQQDLQTAVDPTVVDLLEAGEPQVVTIEARADTSKPNNRSSIAAVMNLEDGGTEQPPARRWMDRAPWEGKLPQGDAGGDAPP